MEMGVMREIVWKEDIRDGIYDGERAVELIARRVIRIVRVARNFIEIEGEEWALDYIRGKEYLGSFIPKIS